jgi:hypothetical protein
MGYLTTASDYGSLVIGRYNSSGSSATNADSFSTANTAFVIGNGADSSNISDAFSILFDGTTNIAGSVTATSFVGDGSGLTGITGTSGSFVDLTTDQTIAGSKTFSSDISVNGVKIGRGTGDHSENTVVGSGALGTGTGQRNTALGRLALGSYSGSSFDNNTAVGYNNSSSVSTGQQNTSIGAEAMLHLTTGSANTAIGAQSLINTTGSNNTSLGYAAGQILTSGNNNTFLGKSSNGSSATLSNSSAIGYEATVAASNTIQLGNTSITDVKTSGTVTAGAVTYINSVGTNGQVLTTDGAGATSWATPSTIATGYSGVLPIANGGTGSATQNFVDLTTAQTIAGAKTFSDNTSVGGTLDVTGDTSVSTFDSSGATSLATGGGVVNVASSGVMTTVEGTLNVDEAVTLDTTLGVTGVATLSAQPILSTLTASLPVFSDGSKGLVSNAITGSGSVVMSASPTLTGTPTLPTGTIATTQTAGNSTTAIATTAFVTTAVAATHAIGDSYGGGIVFFVYDGGQHGLIAATVDQSAGIRWNGGSNTNTRARADGIGAGLKNTAIIIANQGPVDGNAFAATVCNEYSVTVGGVTYGDWYLPSKYELNLLYIEKARVGNFSTNYYWSSTEYDNDYAWAQYFNNGNQNRYYESATAIVRADRAF